MNEQVKQRFAGIERLYGVGALERLQGSRVAVVGMGGVGSWVVEALARSAVGHLTLIDADDICVSNTNRQLPAMEGNYGRNKAEAMAERCRAINPDIEVDAVLALIRKKLRSEFNFPKNAKRYFGVPAVYSLENVKYPQADGSVCGIRPNLGADAALKLDCGAGLGAATHITGAFAFAAVGKALEMLLEPKKVKAEVVESSEV